jgi:hypothetical protein
MAWDMGVFRRRELAATAMVFRHRWFAPRLVMGDELWVVSKNASKYRRLRVGGFFLPHHSQPTTHNCYDNGRGNFAVSPGPFSAEIQEVIHYRLAGSRRRPLQFFSILS